MAVTQLPKTTATKEQEQVETRKATGEAAATGSGTCGTANRCG
jgi:hypothetical protein